MWRKKIELVKVIIQHLVLMVKRAAAELDIFLSTGCKSNLIMLGEKLKVRLTQCPSINSNLLELVLTFYGQSDPEWDSGTQFRSI